MISCILNLDLQICPLKGKSKKAKFISLIQNDMRLKATITATKNSFSGEMYYFW